MRAKSFVVVLALVACSSKSHKDEPAPKDARPPEPQPTKSVELAITHFDTPAIELPKQESFTLLEPGKDPRSPLRYQLASGVPATHRAETKLRSRRLSGGKWGDLVSLPTIRDGFVITADPAKPLQVRPVAAEIAGKTTPDVEQYLATWRTLESRRFSLAFDDRGQLGAITFGDDPANTRSGSAKDELVQRLLATVIPMPAEPVGLGARWRVVTILRQRPAIVKQTATYTLIARTQAAWKIDIQLQRVAEEQLLTDPALPKDVAANLIAAVRKLAGSVEVDPKHPLPTGKLAVQSTMHLRIATQAPQVQELILDDEGTIVLSTER